MIDFGTLGAGGAVRWPVLLTGFQSDAPTVAVELVTVTVGASYLFAARRLGRRGRRWAPRRTLALLAGALAVVVAVGSGLAAYDDVNPPMHVLQHVLLMMVAPPLIVLGRPLELAAQASARPVQQRVVRLNSSRPLAILCGPFGWVVYLATMPVYFLSGLYAASTESGLLHGLTHAWFLAVGLCYWSGVLGIEPRSRRRPFTARLLGVLAAMPLEAALGLALVLWPVPLAPGSTVSQTHAAGQALWMTSMAISAGALVAVVAQWAAADNRRVRRWEQRAAAGTSDSAGGGENLVPEHLPGDAAVALHDGADELEPVRP